MENKKCSCDYCIWAKENPEEAAAIEHEKYSKASEAHQRGIIEREETEFRNIVLNDLRDARVTIYRLEQKHGWLSLRITIGVIVVTMILLMLL